MLQEEWKQAAEAGAGLVELRVDCLRREPDLKRILSERHTPVVFTVRRGADGGLWRGDEERRQRLIREAIVAGVDYIDIEMDVADKLPRPRFGQTRRIISYHNFKEMPDDLDELGEQMQGLDPDIIKVACVAKSVAEASRMLEFVARANQKVPTIGIAMGVGGRLHPNPRRQVRLTVHLRRVQPRPHLRPRHDPAPRPPARLLLRADRRPDRALTPSSATRSPTASARRSTTRPSASSV